MGFEKRKEPTRQQEHDMKGHGMKGKKVTKVVKLRIEGEEERGRSEE